VIHIFEKRSQINASADRVFAWHESPDALQQLIPPGDPVRVIEHMGGIRDGARVVIEIGYPTFAIRWIAIHRNYIEGRRFEDFQARGPFASWRHMHTVTPEGSTACILCDHIEYELPFSPLSEIAAPFVKRKLEATFEYRHRITCDSFRSKRS
jgi:ligand-binding SRPBCC domain-containing protein